MRHYITTLLVLLTLGIASSVNAGKPAENGITSTNTIQMASSVLGLAGNASAIKKFHAPKGTVQTARSLQGSGAYPGIDRFRNITLKKGKIIYGGVPGQTPFYTTKSGVLRAGGSRSKLFKGLQVEPHEVFGYRPGVTAYEVMQDVPAAFGRILANPQHGLGGLPQVVVPDYSNYLRPIYSIPLGQ